jgi:hypothetical protein
VHVLDHAADALALPEAEAAISFLVAHHLTDQQVIDMQPELGQFSE